MSKTWVENTSSGPRVIGGELVQPGEGVFVDDGAIAAQPKVIGTSAVVVNPSQLATLTYQGDGVAVFCGSIQQFWNGTSYSSQASVSGAGNGSSRPVRCAVFGPSHADLNPANTDVSLFVGVMGSSVGASISPERWQVNTFYPNAYLVASGGKGGETTANMLARNSAAASASRKSIQDVIDLRPDVVFLASLDTNDFASLNAGNYRATVDATIANHRQIVRQFLSAGVYVVEEGNYPYSAATHTTPALTRQAVLETNAIYAADAALYPTTMVFLPSASVMGDASGTGRSGNLYSYYACRGHLQGKKCEFKNVRADKFDPWLLDQLLDKLLNRETIQAVLDQLDDAAGRWVKDRAARRTALVLELRTAEKRRTKLYDVIETGGTGAPGVNELGPRIKQLNDQISKVEQALVSIENEEEPMVGTIEVSAEDAAEIFRATVTQCEDPKILRAFVATIAEMIVVQGGDVVVHYKPECLIQMDGNSVRSEHNWLLDLGSNQGPTD